MCIPYFLWSKHANLLLILISIAKKAKYRHVLYNMYRTINYSDSVLFRRWLTCCFVRRAWIVRWVHGIALAWITTTFWASWEQRIERRRRTEKVAVASGPRRPTAAHGGPWRPPAGPLCRRASPHAKPPRNACLVPCIANTHAGWMERSFLSGEFPYGWSVPLWVERSLMGGVFPYGWSMGWLFPYGWSVPLWVECSLMGGAWVECSLMGWAFPYG